MIGHVGERLVTVPADIAAYAERAAIYYESHQSSYLGNRVFAAEGCGERLTYVCDVGGRHRYCVRTSDGGTSNLRP